MTVDVRSRLDAALAETARELLAAALDRIEEVGDLALQVHPAGEGRLALVFSNALSPRSDCIPRRERDRDCGALIIDPDDHGSSSSCSQSRAHRRAREVQVWHNRVSRLAGDSAGPGRIALTVR